MNKLIFLFFSFFVSGVLAQTSCPGCFDSNGAAGITTAFVGDVITYYYNGTSGSGGTWNVNSGNVQVLPGSDSDQITVQMLSAGTFYLSHWNNVDGTKEVFIHIYSATPPTPGTPILQSNQCGYTVIQTPSLPSEGTEWFWQTTPNGQSTSLGSSSGLNVTAGGTYYLQSRYASYPYTWSSTSGGLAVTVKQVPSPPSTNTIINCGPGNITLTATVGAGGTSLKWYNAAGNSISASQVVNSSTTFYASSWNSSTSCESATRTPVNVNIEYVPTPVISLNNYQVCVGSNILGQISGSGTPAYEISSNNGVTWEYGSNQSSGNQFSFPAASVGIWAVRVKMISAAGCTSEWATYNNIDVQSYPALTNLNTVPLCSGTAFIYNPGLPNLFLSWSRPATADQPANSGSNGINEVLTNNTASPINVTYTYTLTSGAGCTSTQTISVTVNPRPAAPSPKVITICQPGLTTLTTTVGAGGTSLKWYNAAGNLISASQVVNSNTTFYASSWNSSTGCESAIRTPVNVIIESVPTPVISLNNYQVCVGSNILGHVDGSGTPTYEISSDNGVTWGYGSNQSSGNQFSFPATSVGIWAVRVKMVSAAGCTSEVATYNNIEVQSYPALTNPLTSFTKCSGQEFVFYPVSSISSSFLWSRPAINGIDANTKSGSNEIREVLTNSTALPVNVTYTYTITSGAGCATTQNIVVTVRPKPMLTSPLNPASICSGAIFGYTAASGSANATFTWSRALVTGISQPASSGSSPISEALTNTTASNVNVTYTVTTTDDCSSSTQNVVVAVKPYPTLSGTLTPPGIKTRTTFSYHPTSATPGATFSWTRSAIAGIDQPGSGGTGDVNETLTNSTPDGIPVNYTFVTAANGCSNTLAQEVVVVVSGLYPNENYIISNTLLSKGIVDENAIEALNEYNKSQSIQYFDGLGRLNQTVVTKGAPGRIDVVQPVAYDQFGREAIKYLPYVSDETSGWKKTNAINSQNSFYNNSNVDGIAKDTNPSAVTLFEPSPLNRVMKQGAPGAAWQPNNSPYASPTDRTIAYSYEFNTASEVISWSYVWPSASYPLGLVTSGTGGTAAYYGANELHKTSTKDEQHNEVIEFKDKEGRVVLKKVQAPLGEYAQTYYAYDDFGSLVCVLPPEAVKAIATSYLGKTDAEKDNFLKRWAFRYQYDTHKHIAIKQVPGADPVYMVYDDRDRLVMTQDGNQRIAHQWLFTKYDVMNRPVTTGLYTDADPLHQTQQQMQGVVNNYYNSLSASQAWFETFSSAAGNVHGYDNKSFPQVSDANAYLTVTYYDDYSFKTLLNDSQFNYTPELTGQYGTANASFLQVRGKVTGTKVKVLESGGTTYLWTANYYDDRYRVAQTVTHNNKGGRDRVSNVYDFTGKVMQMKTTHQTSSATHTIGRRLVYDHAGRLLQTFHKVNDQPEVLLAANEYNELGQVTAKKLFATADPPVWQEGTTYNPINIVATQYNGEKYIIAGNSITLNPGFIVPDGQTLDAHVENVWNAANSNPVNAKFAQVVDYRYNIRGWLTRINNSDLSKDISTDPGDYFGMNLLYEQNDAGLGNASQYNGNISGVKWSTNLGLAPIKGSWCKISVEVFCKS